MKKRTRFRIALAVASDTGKAVTARSFAARHDVSTKFLYEVLRGEGTSARLEREIDRFTRAHLDNISHAR